MQGDHEADTPYGHAVPYYHRYDEPMYYLHDHPFNYGNYDQSEYYSDLRHRASPYGYDTDVHQAHDPDHSELDLQHRLHEAHNIRE